MTSHHLTDDKARGKRVAEKIGDLICTLLVENAELHRLGAVFAEVARPGTGSVAEDVDAALVEWDELVGR